MAYMNEWAAAQPAYAVFYLGQLKNRSFRDLIIDIVATQNDHLRYVKHVLGRIHVFFTLFRYWERRGGSLEGLVNKLLLQFFTVGSSKKKFWKLKSLFP